MSTPTSAFSSIAHKKRTRANEYEKSTKHRRIGSSTTTTSNSDRQPTTDIKTFVFNLLFQLFVQDDDEIAKVVLEKSFAKNLTEDVNSSKMDLKSFTDLTFNLRKQITNRRLIKQEAIVVPGDKDGNSGTVAHSSEISGIENGMDVVIKVHDVATIEFVNGNRLVEVESTLFVIEKTANKD